MFSLVSCARTELTSTGDLSNAEDLSYIVSIIDTYNENQSGIKENINNALLHDTVKPFTVEYDSVILSEKITELFSPDNFSCQLPNRIKGKIKENPNWAPQEIKDKLKNLPKWALHMKDVGVSVILNTLWIKPEGGAEFNIPVLGSPTYSSLDVKNYIDNVRDEFAYTLDCSGYLNAVLSTGLKLSKAEIEASAKVSMDKAGSLILARAHIFSPLYVALKPSAFPSAIELSNDDRLATLYAILQSLPANISDNDEITTPLELEIVWSSISGNSKFNGETSLKSNIDVSIGVASLAFNTQGGMAFSKTSYFKDFETYIIRKNVVPNIDPIKIGDVKSQIIDLTRFAVIEKPAEIVNGKIKVSIRFPQSFKELTWSIKENGYKIEKTDLDHGNLCSFTISGPSNSTNDFITLISNSRGIKLSREIAIPRS